MVYLDTNDTYCLQRSTDCSNNLLEMCQCDTDHLPYVYGSGRTDKGDAIFPRHLH